MTVRIRVAPTGAACPPTQSRCTSEGVGGIAAEQGRTVFITPERHLVALGIMLELALGQGLRAIAQEETGQLLRDEVHEGCENRSPIACISPIRI